MLAMRNQVYVCGTYYHIFISILKSLNKEKEGICNLLIVNDHTPNLFSIAEKLVAEKFFDKAIYVPFFEIDHNIKKQHTLKRIFTRNGVTVKQVEKNSNILSEYDFIKDAEINLFYNLGLSYNYFIIRFKKSYIRMLEDGLRNYNQRVDKIKYIKRHYIFNTAIGEGRDKEVKSIEVQSPERLSKFVVNKGKKLDLKVLKEKMTTQQREKLLKIFDPEGSLNLSGNKKLLLITQPLSEDKIISENEKIGSYQQILKEYGTGFEIFIKAHPREKTNYKECLNIDFIEIPRNFPLELFDLIDGVSFEKAITIFSSAIDNLNCINEKIFLGKDYLKGLS